MVTGVTTDFTPFLFCARARAIRNPWGHARDAPRRAARKWQEPQPKKEKGARGDTPPLTRRAHPHATQLSVSLVVGWGVFLFSIASVCYLELHSGTLWRWGFWDTLILIDISLSLYLKLCLCSVRAHLTRSRPENRAALFWRRRNLRSGSTTRLPLSSGEG